MQKSQVVDTELLNACIANSGLKVAYIADQIGITTQAFAKKRTGKNMFRKSEKYVLCSLLNMPSETASKIFLP